MGKIILLLSLALFLSCCRTLDIGYIHTIDPRLQKDVSAFFETCQLYFPSKICIPDADLQVYVGRLPKPMVGECTIYPDKKLRVVIDKGILGEKDLRLVVFHEMLHCVFDVDHFEESPDIMNADTTHEKEILAHFDFYLEKVFRRIQREIFKK